ncbi:hypothetical protein EJ04DRAFT_79421 [Polyplosphaeria fusca]|uniref:Uncharacterized protein n=1 Tax=Polyplosphaeria fusca TaxID=682080 RepID=A0A9P4R395_9PLEO|nr:hypothetical protein EJ04DRAFT_79421 [Polyplosphaeria fusca]
MSRRKLSPPSSSPSSSGLSLATQTRRAYRWRIRFGIGFLPKSVVYDCEYIWAVVAPGIRGQLMYIKVLWHSSPVEGGEGKYNRRKSPAMEPIKRRSPFFFSSRTCRFTLVNILQFFYTSLLHITFQNKGRSLGMRLPYLSPVPRLDDRTNNYLSTTSTANVEADASVAKLASTSERADDI